MNDTRATEVLMMGAPFYSLAGSRLSSVFFGFSIEITNGWRVSTARVSGKKAMLWLAPASGHSDQLQITVFSRNEARIARYFDDAELAQRTFPGVATYPFGEAMTAPVFHRRLMIRQNGYFMQIDEKEGTAETRAAVEAMLHSLRFFRATADSVPSELMAFRYLHPGAGKDRAATPDAMVEAELEARLADHRSHGHYYDGALIAAVLGRTGEARGMFLEAANQLEQLAFDREPCDLGVFAEALEAALFSGDERRLAALARRTPPRLEPSDLTADRATYSRALGLMALDEDEVCLDEVRTMLEVATVRVRRAGVLELVRCVAQRDLNDYEGALDAVLVAHHRRARATNSEIRNSARSFVCVPATALALMGMRRALPLPASLPHRQATLPRLPVVCAQTAADALVLPGTTMDLAVDYVPPALLGLT